MTRIYYERNKNLGNYETVKIGFDMDIQQGQSAEDAFQKVKEFVVGKLQKEGSLK